MERARSFDVVVIGSGPGGRAAALEAASLGRSVALVERRAVVGGVCVNTGTVPSKALRAAAIDAVEHGNDGRPRPHFALRSLFWPVQRAVAAERAAVEAELRGAGVEVVFGSARLDGPTRVVVGEGEEALEGALVVLAPGSEATRPDAVDFDGRTVLSADDVLDLGTLPLTLTVVGAGLVGIEYASIFAALGSHVTLVEAEDWPLPFADRGAVGELLTQLDDRGVKVRTGTRVESVARRADGTATTFLDDGSWLSSTAVLWAAGRRGAVDGLGLESAGLHADGRGRISVDDAFRTAQPTVLAVGDVSGWLPCLSSTAAAQGRVAVARALGAAPRAEVGLAPLALHAIPELASAGATRQALAAASRPFVAGTARLEELATSRLGTAPASGILELLADAATGRVLGVHVVGGPATELIHVGCLAIQHGLTLADLAATVYAYPSLHAAYGVAASDAQRSREAGARRDAVLAATGSAA